MEQLKVSKIRVDGGTQPRAEIDNQTVNEYRQDMLVGDSFPPLVVFYDGSDYWLADGFHRLWAAIGLKKEEINVDIRQGTQRDAILHSVQANSTHGKRRTNEDKRRAVMRLLEDSEWVQWSDREIARRCAVSHNFVSTMRPQSSLSSDDSEKKYTTKHGTVATMKTANIGKVEEIRHAAVKKPELFGGLLVRTDNGKVTAPHIEQARREYLTPLWGADGESGNPESYEDDEWTPPANKPHVSNNSGNNEWYTPAEFIEAAQLVLGNIDLDPASSEQANEIIKANSFYTKEDDGLDKVWRGKVWMNPPYKAGLIDKFATKIAKHYQNKDVPEAIVLVNNATETAWFGSIVSVASAIVFPQSRVKFWSPSGETGSPLQGQAIIYLGNKPDLFLTEFVKFGWGCYVRL